MSTAVPGESRFKTFALFSLGYNLLVIVWGAYVRASGSGAGCGSHWPLCNGEVIPRPERIQTLIEFTHRLSSGLCLVFAIALMVWAWKVYPKGHPARRASNWTLGFTLSEALVGAGLVLLKYVENDQSVNRAISISIHLVNTLFLVASLTLAVRWSWNKGVVPRRPWNPSLKSWVLATVGGTLILGVTGALTALGDTLFHSSSLAQGWDQDFASGSHFLLKLRILHPALAVAVAVALLFFAELCSRRAESASVQSWSGWLKLAVLGQVAVGATNLFLLAPIPLQLLHLFTADLTWICLIMLCSAALEVGPIPASAEPALHHQPV